MFTLNINGGQKLLGHLEGTSQAVYEWMRQHPADVEAACNDTIYYRHALLGTKAMPFVLKEDTSAVETATNKQAAGSTSSAAAGTPPPTLSSAAATVTDSVLVHRRFNDVAPLPHRKTHFPIEALTQSTAPHIVLTPLGERVKEAWKRMPQVVPQVEHVCLCIMPNHIHAIVAVKKELPRSIGAVVRSFMGVTTHTLHQMMAEGTVQWDASVATLARQATSDKPNLWEEGFCVGVCQTEKKLHTRIGYVLENPFFGLLEKEQHDFMQRVISINIAGRSYSGYGNMLLLKEPDRVQVFCHRKHPITKEPYIQTQDFQTEKEEILCAASNGAVIVTPGISPGESDIMRSVLKAGGSVINIQKEELPINSKWHPDKDRRLYCSQGKMLVLAVNDLPHQVFHDRWGEVIPTDSKYARFHLLNLVAAEICSDDIEHSTHKSRT